MFSKEEAKELTTLFWTSFGKYMQKHKPTFAKHVKWVNYKTGVKDIYFRLHADKKTASIAIELQHQDESIRKLYFEQFTELKTVFTATAGEWIWEEEYFGFKGNEISRIYLDHDIKFNIFIKDTWGECFQFFEKHIVNLDEFWCDFNEIFKNLSD